MERQKMKSPSRVGLTSSYNYESGESSSCRLQISCWVPDCLINLDLFVSCCNNTKHRGVLTFGASLYQHVVIIISLFVFGPALFLLYHSETCNIYGAIFYKCYVNDLRTTTCSGISDHRTGPPLTSPSPMLVRPRTINPKFGYRRDPTRTHKPKISSSPLPTMSRQPRRPHLQWGPGLTTIACDASLHLHR
jgi:hypothetical protein